jgi:hypothetical protein
LKTAIAFCDSTIQRDNAYYTVRGSVALPLTKVIERIIAHLFLTILKIHFIRTRPIAAGNGNVLQAQVNT